MTFKHCGLLVIISKITTNLICLIFNSFKPIIEFVTMMNIPPFPNSNGIKIDCTILHPTIVNYFTDQFCYTFFLITSGDNPCIYIKFEEFLFVYLDILEATAASEMPCKSSFSILMLGVVSISPIIRMTRPGTAIRHTPNNIIHTRSGSVSMSHRKY
jgi:hypothetical protein